MTRHEWFLEEKKNQDESEGITKKRNQREKQMNCLRAQ